MKIPFKVDLTGKTAIVTGGSGTLCSAMAGLPLMEQRLP